MANCEKELNWWNKHKFGHVRREIEIKKSQLILAEREALVSGNNNRIRSLRMEINLLQRSEERV